MHSKLSSDKVDGTRMHRICPQGTRTPAEYTHVLQLLFSSNP